MKIKRIILTAITNLILVVGFSQDFWTFINTTPDSTLIESMMISPSGDIYLGMSGFDYAGGIYKSTNNGQTWEYSGLNGKGVYALEICPNGDIIAGVFSGIFKSIDSGNSWYEVYYGIENITCLLSLSNGYILAGGTGNSHGVFRSTDYGESWDTVYIFPGFGEENIETISLSPEGYIYAGTYNMFGTSGIYRSTDLGETWESVYFPSEDVYSIAFHPDGDLLVGCLGNGLYRYHQNTGQWTHDLFNVTPDDVLFVGNNEIFLGCNGQPLSMEGILYSNDGGQNYDWLNTGMDGGSGAPINKMIRTIEGYIYAQSFVLFRSTLPVITNMNFNKIIESFKAFNYPNPFKSKTIIKWSINVQDQFIQLIIRDARGYIIENVILENNGFYNFQNMSLEPGILYYSIIGTHSSHSGKMVLIK
jgi:WD40 repeat protein